MPVTGPSGLAVSADANVEVPRTSGIVSWPAPPSALLRTPFTSVPSVNAICAGEVWPVKPNAVPLPLVLLKIPA